MGKLSGAVLILAGLGLGAHTLGLGRDAGPEIAALRDGGIGKAPGAAQAALTRVPPAAPPVAEIAPPAKPAIPAVVPPPPAAQLRPAPPPAVRVAEAPPRVPVGEIKSAGGPPLDRATLTRSIQRELKRIGCYQGQVSDVWTPAVRQAMKAFTNRVNASLPVDRPDAVLLAMVQSQEPGTCSASCPAGQGRLADGRCLPNALIAGTGKPAAAKAATSTAASAGRAKPPQAAPSDATVAIGTKTPQPDPGDAGVSPHEGRMSLAGPSDASARPVGDAGGRPRAARRHARVATHTRAVGARWRQPPRAAYLPYGGYPSWVPFGLP